MRVTIDKAGRVIVPKPIRDRFDMQAGTTLELEVSADGIYLKVIDQGPSLYEKQGILVHHGSEKVDLDMADTIDRERSRRNSDIAAEYRTK